MKYLFHLILLLLSSVCLSKASIEEKLENLLHEGVINMSVLGVHIDPEMEDIGGKFQRSIAQHKEWLLKYIDKHSYLKPGELMPYHKNFGISEIEYKKFIADAKSAKMVELYQLTMSIVSIDSGYTLSIEQPNSTFKDIHIELSGANVSTKLGTLSNMKLIEPNQKNASIGKWKGISWSLKDGDIRSGSSKSIKLSVGKIIESDALFIQYVVKIYSNGTLIVNEEINMRHFQNR